MSEFRQGDRVRVVAIGGYTLSKKERTGTVTRLWSPGLVEVRLDNYSGGELSFRPHQLVKEIPAKQAKVKFLGITILTIEGDL